MKKVSIDIKNGQFVAYPSGEVYPFLEGYVSNSFFRNAKGVLQFKVVIINNDTEFIINGLANTLSCQSLITELVNKNESKIHLVLEKRIGENGEYFLVKNKKNLEM